MKNIEVHERVDVLERSDDVSPSLPEPTLANLLRGAARARMPERFYWLLQTCTPWALQFWALGWHRAAGWLGVVSIYGLWAIAEKRLEEYGEATPLGNPGKAAHRVKMWRTVRAGTAVVGVVGAVVLLLDLLIRAMSRFPCGGCAG